MIPQAREFRIADIEFYLNRTAGGGEIGGDKKQSSSLPGWRLLGLEQRIDPIPPHFLLAILTPWVGVLARERKSTTLLQWRPMPMRKLSGLMSRWMNDLPWTNSTRPTIWSANISTVLVVNLRVQKLNKSSSEGPNKSITRTLYDLSCPYHLQQKY